MSEAVSVFPTTTGEERDAAVDAAARAVHRGELVVIPTDTVYGIGADAFTSTAVQALLDAKGRGREMPPPVLVSAPGTLNALATAVPAWCTALVEAFWPGPLTVICHQQASLTWDLGETRGTVAVRMPDDEIALEVIERTGPMAVSSANLSGQEAARDVADAQRMLGDSVSVYVDGGQARGGVASTIVDCTGERPRILRSGALSVDQLDSVLAPLGTSIDTSALAGSPEPGEGEA